MGSSIVDAYRLLLADVYELAGRSHASSDAIARALGQTAARWHVLSVVQSDARTVPEIADRLGQARQSVQRVVNDLVAERLVRLNDNPRHRRSRLVELTPAGYGVVEELFAVSSEHRQAQLDRMAVTTTELERTRETIRRLVSALDDRPS